MVRKPKVSLSFVRLTPANKIIFGEKIIKALTENAETFPNLPVKEVVLTQVNEDLRTALVAASTGDHVAIKNLELAEQQWINNFRQEAFYVNIVADGNAATIKLGGFDNTKTETNPSQTPGAPNNLQTNVNGNKGNLSVSCDALPAARAFVFTALPAGASISFNGDVMSITVGDVTAYVYVTTKRKVNFNALTSGTAIDVGVYAVNSAGSGPLANGQHVIAQ